MNGYNPISAVIFDMDGTLLNPEQLTKDLLGEFLLRYGKVVDEEKEVKRLGMIQSKAAIGIVEDYDLPITPQQFIQSIMPMFYDKWPQAKPLPGVNRLIKHLHKHGVPFSVASNSARKHVEAKVLGQIGWKDYFPIILGSDDVKSGKPSPDLFLEAANRMGVDPTCCLVLEDSLVGVKAGKAANMQVVAVPSIEGESDEFSIADVVIHSFLDFQPELWGLTPFEDWVMNALPIEPLHFKASYKAGFLQESSDKGVSDLPTQAWGIYFGWVDFDSQARSKIVVSMRWVRSCDYFQRNIQACLLNGYDEQSNDQNDDQPMKVALVGYIRGFRTQVTK
ncbi:bifunctional riboflavin kinase/FMN phosphatase-like [Rutidosis leptorrhynchoides]|uniref:bifunctional riboflavin kinase/FMN phosphatase-like n=1 Tax=Rutidosis leptorrhynchoides TaxID=125765 RepID=UPI003A99D1BD